MTARARLVLVGVAVCLVAGGCASTGGDVPETDVFEPVQEPVALKPPVYRLQIGDELRVVFLTDDALSYDAPITPSGTVTLPMSGEIVASGKTVTELGAEIEEYMGEYLLDPTASVAIRSIAKQWVYVIGEVKHPGRFELDAGMTVTGALSQAGGLLSSGKPSSVMLVRTVGVEEPTAFRVNMDDIFTGSDFSSDMSVVRNDVVYVPKSFIGKVDEFVYLFFDQTLPVMQFWLYGYEIALRADGIKWWWQ
jgi:polysaccharide export outer membrane protein